MHPYAKMPRQFGTYIMQLLSYQNSEWAEITISHKYAVKVILGYITRKSKNKYGFFIVQNFMQRWLYADIYMVKYMHNTSISSYYLPPVLKLCQPNLKIAQNNL
jgi:hypothetical protein